MQPLRPSSHHLREETGTARPQPPLSSCREPRGLPLASFSSDEAAPAPSAAAQPCFQALPSILIWASLHLPVVRGPKLSTIFKVRIDWIPYIWLNHMNWIPQNKTRKKHIPGMLYCCPLSHKSETRWPCYKTVPQALPLKVFLKVKFSARLQTPARQITTS